MNAGDHRVSEPLTTAGRDVVVTGIGIVSSLGEGAATHVDAALRHAEPRIDPERFAPYVVHPAVPLDFEHQIPKKADLRQMEAWQKLGTYAAGAALADAGLAGNRAALADMHLIVACGGGERDYAVDGQILTGMVSAADPAVFLNERLMSDIRPTLFLAQLSNLLAGNIAIVHGVTGASRTFMGEERAGVDALRIARARIASGQNELFLVGGATNAERPDLLLVYAMAGLLWTAPFAPVAARGGAGGFIPGSLAAFLVLESRAHAEARGARAIARLGPVLSASGRRSPGSIAASLDGLARPLAPLTGDDSLIVSGATGLAEPTREELAALDRIAPNARRIIAGDLVGHGVEAQFPFAVALAAAMLDTGDRVAQHALATSVGHWRGEGLALVEKA